MDRTYVEIMLQSLKKKSQVLDEIIMLNKDQRSALESPELTPEEFDVIVEKKGELIEQLDKLDSGFEKVFDRMKEELDGNKEAYREEIRKMQEYIRTITDKSIEIQSQEARNKELMTQKFASVKKQVRTMKKSSAVASKYYQNMSRVNLVDPQLWDGKQ